MSRGSGLQRTGTLTAGRPLQRGKPLQSEPADTGFSAAAKLAIRTRAGQGDADDALCEGCGIWCGRYGGQVHHIVDRLQAAPEIRNTIVNGLLLHGSALTGCHGRATACEPHFNGMGFWLYSWQTPGEEGVMLYGASEGGYGGTTVYLTTDGGYSIEPPSGSGAA